MQTPDVTRGLAYASAVNRVLFGVRFMVAPAAAGPTWIGPREARRSGTQVFIRASPNGRRPRWVAFRAVATTLDA